MSFDEHGLAVVSVSGALLYVARSGRTAPAFFYDNGADYFAQGLARTVRDGKVGYVDRHLSEVIAPRWDFASPFKDGMAAVCTGCKTEYVGEHSRVAGGHWGYIDRKGRVIVPVTFTEQDLPSHDDAVRRRRPERE
jgi:hypothetical protein